VTGQVTKITNFGVFVQLERELEGLLHVSELGAEGVDTPEEIVKVDQEIQVRVLRVDTSERKIGLSLKLEPDSEELSGEAATDAPPITREELRGGMGAEAGPLFSMPQAEEIEVAEFEKTEEIDQKNSESDDANSSEGADAPAEENL
jgi:small subunit ribosomal protein S1